MPSVLHPRPATAVPFLALAYPATFAFVQRFPGRLSTVVGLLQLLAILVVTYAVAAVVAARLLRGAERGGTSGGRETISAVVEPPRAAAWLLAGTFALFLLFLGFDATGTLDGLWQPIVLPLSFPLFLPVWVLYSATFVLAVLGVNATPVLTTVTRLVIVVGGFGLSAIWQAALATAIVRVVSGRGQCASTTNR